MQFLIHMLVLAFSHSVKFSVRNLSLEKFGTDHRSRTFFILRNRGTTNRNPSLFAPAF